MRRGPWPGPRHGTASPPRRDLGAADALGPGEGSVSRATSSGPPCFRSLVCVTSGRSLRSGSDWTLFPWPRRGEVVGAILGTMRLRFCRGSRWGRTGGAQLHLPATLSDPLPGPRGKGRLAVASAEHAHWARPLGSARSGISARPEGIGAGRAGAGADWPVGSPALGAAVDPCGPHRSFIHSLCH